MAKIDKNKNERLNFAGDATLVGAAGIGTVGAGLNVRAKKYKYNPANADSSRLLLLAEGGPNSIGGTGHESAAKALAEAHERQFGKGTAKIVYTNDHNTFKSSHNAVEKVFKNISTKSGIGQAVEASKMPFVYSMSKSTNRKSLHSEIQNFNPGRVISTHPKSTEVAAKFGLKAEQVVTDYGIDTNLMKSFWNSPHSSAQYSAVNNPSKGDIKIPSLPISNRYLNSTTKKSKGDTLSFILRDNKKNELKTVTLNSKIPTVLAMSGSTGAQLDETVTQALKSKAKFNLIAVTGKNEELRNRLSSIKDSRLVVQGYETDMDSLISKADLGILRPHGLSATEVAGKGLPFIPTVTNRTSDAWGPHMVGNAKWYSDRSGIATSALDEDGDLAKNLDSSLKNLKSVKQKNKKLTNLVRQDAAKIITSSPNRTILSGPQKLPFGLKGLAAVGGLAGVGYGMKALAKENKDVKEDAIAGTAGAATGGIIARSAIIKPMLSGAKDYTLGKGVALTSAIIGAGSAGAVGLKNIYNKYKKEN